MRLILERLFATLAALVLLAGPAAADVFTVRGVEVDETADTAANARERAIAVGQQLAARRLLERLTLPEDLLAPSPAAPLDPAAQPLDPEAAPELAPDALPVPAPSATNIDSATVQRMVSGFQVEEEALAGPRYIGRLTVTFDPISVRDWLDSLGIPYVLSSARPAVIVPLWREGEETRLWGGGNPWFDAWSVAGTADELVPVLAPSGDLADISVIDAPRALALDRAALQALAANYGSAHVLVALAGPAPGAAPTTPPAGEPAAPAPAPVDPAAQTNAADPAAAAVPPVAPAVVPSTPISMRLVGIDFAHGGQPVDYGSLTAADPVELARATAGLLQDGWKRNLSTANSVPPTTAAVNVLYRTADEWMALQNVIGSEPLVQMARLDALTNDGALMTLQHRGTPEQLALVLREHGAELAQTQRGLAVTWVPPLGAPAPGTLPMGEPGGQGPAPATVGPDGVTQAPADPAAAEEPLYE